jgi:hypothetical protein
MQDIKREGIEYAELKCEYAEYTVQDIKSECIYQESTLNMQDIKCEYADYIGYQEVVY